MSDVVHVINSLHFAVSRQNNWDCAVLWSSPENCIDQWQDPDFSNQLIARFRMQIEQIRIQGDVVLVLSLHDGTSGKLGKMIEYSLEQVLFPEVSKSSLQLTCAFVFDSYAHTINQAPLKNMVLWCPSVLSPSDFSNDPCNLQ
ncbi:hypothetical protein BCY86_08855 [Pajaroellobacter abortibovis]|uniref:Uncharacterized protein n=1 Tax=Pajaroellobacter abortibovis TaxID=1882918 RepID=A0A1L6MZ05_9BACT|nr:hypothetical protein BCY86_08855 [Pajaroellobacter abortibovis]